MNNCGHETFMGQCIDCLVKTEEETKVDELKVYTGKETIEALLEGKTLQYQNNYNQLIRYEDNQFMTKDGDSQWRRSLVSANGLLTIKMTEVVTPQVGDWVRVTIETGKVHVGKLIDTDSGGATAFWNNDPVRGYLGFCFEKRTWEILSPEQVSEYKREQAFVKVGRKPNEFKSGDIVYINCLDTVATVISKRNEANSIIKLHGINEVGKGYDAGSHQLTPISFVEQQVDLS
ncbi:hypothetical protein OCB07_15865 [Bacillus cereus]|nr:hypothetical protein [Bacillus cereus]